METTAQPRPRKHWMRACAVAMTALAVIVLLSGQVSWWRILLALLLLACPAIVIWTAFRFGRSEDFQPETDLERNARHEP